MQLCSAITPQTLFVSTLLAIWLLVWQLSERRRRSKRRPLR